MSRYVPSLQKNFSSLYSFPSEALDHRLLDCTALFPLPVAATKRHHTAIQGRRRLGRKRGGKGVRNLFENIKSEKGPDTFIPSNGARYAPVWFLSGDPDEPRSREAAERVLAAFHKAVAEGVMRAPSPWDLIEARSRPFIDALHRGNHQVVRDKLARMFHEDLIWGLGHVCAVTAAQLRGLPRHHAYQLRFADVLVSLGEAVAASRLTSAEQLPERHLHALDRDLDELYRAIERRTGLELSLPQVGGGYGCVVGDQRPSIDTLIHGYTIYRLRQLGIGTDARMVEIGGGYGCLAAQFHRAGQRSFAIYDLPWVSAIQGYFLIMALPPGTVRLYGEADGTVEVLPFWRFHDLPERSIDAVINTNSLPEMGRETARGYIERIGKVLRGVFLSVNQEAGAIVGDCEPQLCVAQLVEEVGSFRTLSRQRYWMRQGYAEEVFECG